MSQTDPTHLSPHQHGFDLDVTDPLIIANYTADQQKPDRPIDRQDRAMRSGNHHRLACLLDWAAYRDTIDLSGKDNLCRFLAEIRTWPPFAETAPNL